MAALDSVAVAFAPLLQVAWGLLYGVLHAAGAGCMFHVVCCMFHVPCCVLHVVSLFVCRRRRRTLPEQTAPLGRFRRCRHCRHLSLVLPSDRTTPTCGAQSRALRAALSSTHRRRWKERHWTEPGSRRSSRSTQASRTPSSVSGGATSGRHGCSPRLPRCVAAARRCLGFGFGSSARVALRPRLVLEFNALCCNSRECCCCNATLQRLVLQLARVLLLRRDVATRVHAANCCSTLQRCAPRDSSVLWSGHRSGATDARRAERVDAAHHKLVGFGECRHCYHACACRVFHVARRCRCRVDVAHPGLVGCVAREARMARTVDPAEHACVVRRAPGRCAEYVPQNMRAAGPCTPGL